ncbi:MAG: polyprenyl synthetase family protein [Planctomycetota bacterium]
MNREVFLKNLPLFEKEIARKRERLNAYLGKYLPEETCYPPVVHQAMRYAVLGDHRRIWGIMTIFAAESCKGEEEEAIPVACAMECIHALSVVHGNLPGVASPYATPGQPSVPRAFGEGVALLAGDALILSAFELIAREVKDGELVRLLVAELCKHLGSTGMLGGFVMDILSRGRTPDQKTIEYVYSHKAGSLAAASVVLGAATVKGSSGRMSALGQYGLKVGTAMHIMEDIVRAEESVEEVGMGLRWRREKEERAPMDFVRLCGIDQARKEASRLTKEAVEDLRPLGRYAGKLAYLANYLLYREQE